MGGARRIPAGKPAPRPFPPLIAKAQTDTDRAPPSIMLHRRKTHKALVVCRGAACTIRMFVEGRRLQRNEKNRSPRSRSFFSDLKEPYAVLELRRVGTAHQYFCVGWAPPTNYFCVGWALSTNISFAKWKTGIVSPSGRGDKVEMRRVATAHPISAPAIPCCWRESSARQCPQHDFHARECKRL